MWAGLLRRDKEIRKERVVLRNILWCDADIEKRAGETRKEEERKDTGEGRIGSCSNLSHRPTGGDE